MSFEELGIELKGYGVQQKVKCPKCIEAGKKNWKDTCLAVNTQLGVFHCHKCGWSGSVKRKSEYGFPEIEIEQNSTDLPDKALELFTGRGITQDVVKANQIKVTKDKKSVAFQYFFEGNLVNYKIRHIAKKGFQQKPGGKHVIYNYDRVKDSEEIIITEGEFDAMAFEVAGYIATSVSQGAPNENDKSVDKKLECITNCYQVFEQAKVVYIAVDNDPNGKRLEKELIKRIGAEKCKLVILSPYKDANEFLIYEGKEELKKRLDEAKEVKLDGIFTVTDAEELMLNFYYHGKPRGTTTHFPAFDKAWMWRKTDVNLWIGYNNDGKSTFFKQIALIKALFDGWRFAFYSPEDMPLTDFFDDLIEMYVGKTCDKYYESIRMNVSEYMEAMNRIRENIYVIEPKGLATPDELFDLVQFCIRKYDIDAFSFDPYNCIDHDYGKVRDDLYISSFMGRMKKFAVQNDICANLTAHLNTPQKKEDGTYPCPDKYKIKGGGTFSDKADNVISVWRPDSPKDRQSPVVYVESHKIKKQRLVGVPQNVEFMYDWKSNRYMLDRRNPLGNASLQREEPETNYHDQNPF